MFSETGQQERNRAKEQVGRRKIGGNVETKKSRWRGTGRRRRSGRRRGWEEKGEGKREKDREVKVQPHIQEDKDGGLAALPEGERERVRERERRGRERKDVP